MKENKFWEVQFKFKYPKNLAEDIRVIGNAIVYEMRKSQYETDKRQISLKDKINFKKKGYLEHNGIETSWTIEEDLKEYDNMDKNKENKKNTEINDGEKKEFKNKLNKKHLLLQKNLLEIYLIKKRNM